MADEKIYGLVGKISITGKLRVETGMHIGGSSDFSPIGSVDSPFIRDILTNAPIIPGSSIKGKMRTLLAKSECPNIFIKKIEEDGDVVSRLFGQGGKDLKYSRLQFFDLFVTEESKDLFKNIDTDTYMGEVKFENTINRLTGIASPRQIERVPAGVEFDFKLVYNVEKTSEVEADMDMVAKGFELLSMDYLGGNGSRGYGRISFNGLECNAIGDLDLDMVQLTNKFSK